MLTLGILETTSAMYQEISKEFETEPYALKKIVQKEQVKSIDGLILPLEMKEDFVQVVEWLVACQQFPTVFVWVVTTNLIDFQESVFLDLGVNAVIRSEENEYVLKKIINNTFKRIENNTLYSHNNSPDFLLNDENQLITVRGEEQTLTRLEFKILKYLYKNKNQTVSYDKLMQYVWPKNPSEKLYRLSNTIFHLRKKINNNAQLDIKNVRSRGYRLVINE